ncbi:MAG: DUF3267 domain-containing protein [Faecousia sp.]
MKLHYKGKYDLNPESLPHGEHMPGAVPFKEAKDSRQLSIIANAASVLIMVLLAVPAWFRCREYLWASPCQVMFGTGASMLILFPHEILHAVCFKEDVYLYTNWKQGLLFVVGPETMSKSRFILMSLFPNVVFGFIPYLLGMLFPNLIAAVVLGILATGMGAGDYYNVFNAATQMPRGSRTYLYQFSSYWYMPQ